MANAVPEPWTAALAILILSLLGTRLAIGFSRRAGVIAHPGARDSHSEPTPSGAGIGFVVALAILSWIPVVRDSLPTLWWQVAVPAMVVLSVIGWLDDRAGVSWRLRLAVQLVVSLSLIYVLHDSHGDGFGFSTPAVGWLAGAALVPALVWLMNAYNFMDGSDGMAAGQGVFAGALLAMLFQHEGRQAEALASLLIAASCLGFLPWNLPRARAFMGDAGSVPLGLGLGFLTILAWAGAPRHGVVAILALAPFLVDSSLTLLLRLARGERWYTAHRQHLYQRLIRRGWSHGRVLLLYQGINWLLALPVAALALNRPGLSWPLTGTVMTLLAAAWIAASAKLEKELERP